MIAADILDLLEDVQDGDLDAARKLADIVARAMQRPDRRVGAALQPKKRGGESEWQAEQRTERNAGYRDFAVAEYGTALLTPKQTKALARKVKRLIAEVHLMEGGISAQQDAVGRIRASCVGIVGPRQLLRILPEKK